MINRVVLRWNRTVPPGVQRLELIIHVNFLARLQPRQQILALGFLKFSAVQVDAIFCIDPIAMFGQQPIHAICRAAFFIRCQRQNQIAIRNVAFLFQRHHRYRAVKHVRLVLARAVFVENLDRRSSGIGA